MRKRTIAGLIAAGAVAVAIGSASTASNTIPDSVAGYGTSTITGATATALHYTLSADGTTITDAALTFSGDLTGKNVEAGFGTDNLTTCTVGAFTPGSPGSTAVTCTGFTQDTAASATFNVTVND
jgi:hypothetical protein